MFFDIYSAIYCLYTVPLLTKRFKDLLTENTKRERRNFPMKERRERRKSQRRGESHARSLRNRERREIRDVHFFERRNAREQTTSGSLGASCRVPPLCLGSQHLCPLCLGVGRYFGVNLVAGLTTRPENGVTILVLRYLRRNCEGKDEHTKGDIHF